MLRLLCLRSRERPRMDSGLRLPREVLSLLAVLAPGDTDLRRVRDRSLELDEEEDEDDDELEELDPELLRDEDEDELEGKTNMG